MQFKNVVGGVASGLRQGIQDLSAIERLNQERNESKLRQMEMASLMAPVNPEEFEWWGELDEGAKKYISSGLDRYGRTRYGLQKTFEETNQKDALLDSVLNAQSKTASVKFANALAKREELLRSNTPEAKTQLIALEAQLPKLYALSQGIKNLSDQYRVSREVAEMYNALPASYKPKILPFLKANNIQGASQAMLELLKGETRLDIEDRKNDRAMQLERLKISNKPKYVTANEVTAAFDALENYKKDPTPENLAKVKALGDVAGLNLIESEDYDYKWYDALLGNYGDEAKKRASKIKTYNLKSGGGVKGDGYSMDITSNKDEYTSSIPKFDIKIPNAPAQNTPLSPQLAAQLKAVINSLPQAQREQAATEIAKILKQKGYI